MKRYKNLSRLIPAGVMLTIWMLGCQTTTEMTTRAIPDGATARDVTPRLNAATYFAHAHLLERQGRYVRAVERYERALSLQPKYISARNRLGITLNKLGRNAEASEQFRLAVQARPNLAYLQNNLGFSLYLEGKNGPALAALEQAIELTPDFARARLNLALVLARFGRFDEAYAQFQRVCVPADAHFNMGIVLSDAGEYIDASAHLQQALALNPDLAGAKTQLDQVAALADEQRRTEQTRLAKQTADQQEEPTQIALEQNPAQVEEPAQTDEPAESGEPVHQTEQMRLAELEAAAALERATELALQAELERRQQLAETNQGDSDETLVAGETEVAEAQNKTTQTDKTEAVKAADPPREPQPGGLAPAKGSPPPDGQKPVAEPAADPPTPQIESETDPEDEPIAVSTDEDATDVTPPPVEDTNTAVTPANLIDDHNAEPVETAAVAIIEPTETQNTDLVENASSDVPAAVESVQTDAAPLQATPSISVEQAFGVDSPAEHEPDLLLVDPVVPTEVEPVPTTLIPELFIGGSLENILDYAAGRSDSIDNNTTRTNSQTAGEPAITTTAGDDAASKRLIANVDNTLDELIQLLGLQRDDFEEMLCEFAYYLYPETAPQPTSDQR